MSDIPAVPAAARPARPDPLAPERIGELLAERLRALVTDVTVAHGQATVTVTADALARAAQVCKREAALAMDFYDFAAGVDLGDEGFALVHRLASTSHGHDVLLRAVAAGGRDAPRLPSLTGVYRGANWHEREAYDMFGIEFDGHPGLEPRILTVENFEGWPLRKEFKLAAREAKPWPGEKVPVAKEEPKEQATGADDAPAEAAAPADGGEDKAAKAREKAERAKRKAAEMRAKKAAERAQAQREQSGDEQSGDEQSGSDQSGSDQAGGDGEGAGS